MTVLTMLKDELQPEIRKSNSDMSEENINLILHKLLLCVIVERTGVLPTLPRLSTVLNMKFKDISYHLSELFSRMKAIPLFEYNTPEVLVSPELRRVLLNMLQETEVDWWGLDPCIFEQMYIGEAKYGTKKERITKEIISDTVNMALIELQQEFGKCKERYEFDELLNKLSKVYVLDPTCKYGGFLAEMFMQLGSMTNKVYEQSSKASPIEFSRRRFVGVTKDVVQSVISETALWFAELKWRHFNPNLNENEINSTIRSVVVSDPLEINWKTLVQKSDLGYIIGSPASKAYNFLTKEEIAQLPLEVPINYASCWFFKAAELMIKTQVRTVFAVNPLLTSGEQAGWLWSGLKRKGAYIISADKRHEMSIVMFTCGAYTGELTLRSKSGKRNVQQISAYMTANNPCLLQARNEPFGNAPMLAEGCSLSNSSGYIFSKAQMLTCIEETPEAEKYFREIGTHRDLLLNKPKYLFEEYRCSRDERFWLYKVIEAIQRTREQRLAKLSERQRMRVESELNSLFENIQAFSSPYIAIPKFITLNKRYLPAMYIDNNIICTDQDYVVHKASLTQYGVIMSDIHSIFIHEFARTDVEANSLRYSRSMIYNNFPWLSEDNPEIIETAKKLIEVWENYKQMNMSLLYDADTMPEDLLTAHRQNDEAVRKAYGISVTATDEEVINELMCKVSVGCESYGDFRIERNELVANSVGDVALHGAG